MLHGIKGAEIIKNSKENFLNLARVIATGLILLSPIEAKAYQEVSEIPGVTFTQSEKDKLMEMIAPEIKQNPDLLKQGIAKQIVVDSLNIQDLQKFINNWIKEEFRGEADEESLEEMLDSMTIKEGDRVIFIMSAHQDDPENFKIQIKIRR